MKKMRVLDLLLCSLFAALSAILCQISIPIGVVPINLTHISLFIAGGLLGAKYGTISQIIFVALGAIGVPVFSGFSGGIGAIVGPRGGFVISYILCTLVVGLIIDKFGKSIKVLILAMLCGLIVTYLCGITWFMYITNTGLVSALLICMFPFLLGDALKVVVSIIAIRRLSILLYNKIR